MINRQYLKILKNISFLQGKVFRVLEMKNEIEQDISMELRKNVKLCPSKDEIHHHFSLHDICDTKEFHCVILSALSYIKFIHSSLVP